MSTLALSGTLKSFQAFANTAGVGANQAAEFSGGTVQPANTTANAFMRTFFPWKASVKQAISTNNNVRQQFLTALMDQFCRPEERNYDHLPDYIKTALIGSNAKTGSEDFKLDLRGHVTSGKPLTARRIRAVMNAIARNNVLPKNVEIMVEDKTGLEHPVPLTGKRNFQDNTKPYHLARDPDVDDKVTLQRIKNREIELQTKVKNERTQFLDIPFQNLINKLKMNLRDVIKLSPESQILLKDIIDKPLYTDINEKSLMLIKNKLINVGIGAEDSLQMVRNIFLETSLTSGTINSGLNPLHIRDDKTRIQFNDIRNKLLGHLFDTMIREYDAAHPKSKFVD